MEANPREGERESWCVGLSPGFSHALEGPGPTPQLILSSRYFRLSWYSFPCALKRSGTDRKRSLMSACVTQQLAHTQPSALGHVGCSAHTHILLSLGKKLSAVALCSPHPPASPALFPQNLEVSLVGREELTTGIPVWAPGMSEALPKVLLGLHTRLASRVHEEASLTQAF